MHTHTPARHYYATRHPVYINIGEADTAGAPIPLSVQISHLLYTMQPQRVQTRHCACDAQRGHGHTPRRRKGHGVACDCLDFEIQVPCVGYPQATT